jgi:hypothetical protein
LFGIDFKPQANFLLLLSVVFAALGFLLIVLRRSAYGRRLTAMKNSPAACATLGMNIVRMKVSVFMLSSAVAGLGGCLFAQEIGAVTGGRFSLFESMTMLMLLVVAGAGYVAGGFAAGLLYGAVFVTMQSIFAKLAHDYSAFHGPLLWLAQFTTVLPALIGVGLGRRPSGFLDDAFRSWKRLIRATRPIFVTGVAAELLAWLLAFQRIISNWDFVVVTAALVALLPRIGAALAHPAAGAADAADAGPLSPSVAQDSTPLERIGLDRPFTVEDLRQINIGMGLAPERT